MKKYIPVLCLLMLSSSVSFAQEKLGVATVIGAATSNNVNLNRTLTQSVNGVNTTFTIQKVGISVGLPYMGVIDAPHTNNPSQYYRHDLGYPWGIGYRYNTFSEDAFTVSKGYFSDKIEINWDVKSNFDKVKGINVYRTEDITSVNPDWGKSLKTLPADAGTFVDANTEGGKLYRYKIEATKVEAEGVNILYTTYITGIGYRNPTGIITGNVSFTGGNPVKDVLIVANPTGSTLRFGSSLKVPGTGYISVPRLNKSLKDSITLQAWIKPESVFNNDELTLYTLESNANETLNFKVKMALEGIKNVLTVTVGSHSISLSDYIPSGEINNKGEDVLIPITNLNTSFTHFSAVLRNNQAPEIYINGRLITAAYVDKMNASLDKNTLSGTPPTVFFTSTNTLINLNATPNGNVQTWSHFKMGGGKLAYLDEFRVWATALSPAQIQRDYRRYLKGNEAFLNTYIRANEKTGDYAYDLAHTGFNFNGNDAKLSNPSLTVLQTPTFDDSNANIPTNTQLGVLGVTDEFGNYTISAIPYSGNGDSFTIVPSLGQHEFNPKQELAFLGMGSSVVNNVDFIDKSSFVFKGKAVYDSRGVFPATSDAPITGNIRDNEVYNAYVKGDLKYQKGEYWAVKNAAGAITSLQRYAAIPVPGAFVSIDNVQAIDANNVPIQTDINGQFTLEVPIGKHAISITKNGHTFAFGGRYPAKDSTVANGVTSHTNTYQDFYEDRDEPITFIDNTKVIVVGRVVGGTIQANKTIGFGYDGSKTHSYTDASGIARTVTYTSVNNIGSARLTLGYLPVGATSYTPEYRTSFITNSQTGEYRVSLLPLSYLLAQNDLTFTSGINPGGTTTANPGATILSAGRPINFTAIKSLQYPKFTQGSDTITGQPYQEILKFTYMATPVHRVISQTSEINIISGGTTYTVSPNQITPIYKQFADYEIRVQSQEIYRNYDAATLVESMVPVEGGSLIATNNLALANSEKSVISTIDPSILIYTFKGGTPNTDAATGFRRTIDLKFRSNGVDYPMTGYKTEGIVLGGVADGTQTFVTAGPEIPDFILRDPPGSSSTATIEKGSSFSFTKENTARLNDGTDLNATVSLGFELSVGGGLLGPVIKTEVKNDITSGVSVATSSSNGKTVTNTYSFNQKISTSDNKDWIGSDADLYIGTSANQFYGTYNELVASTTQNSTPIAVSYRTSTGTVANTNLYPKINTAIYFNESPEKTLFVYSQRNILNDIIPKYLDIIGKIDNGTLIENTNGTLTKAAYNASIKLWRKIILNNELSKYQALNNKDSLKTSLNSIIESLRDPATRTFSASAQKLKDLLNTTFYENISFDAGIGEFTKGFQIEDLTSNSLSYELQIDASVALTLGATLNAAGFKMDTKTTRGFGSGSSSNNSNNKTTNISYTLKDNDSGNSLSVDVINAFDGNGPIFITKGGETSCPYEGAELSRFYNPTHANVTNTSGPIVNLAVADRMPLSIATMALERPEITVAVAQVTGVFEGRNAEFVLQLRNRSTIRKDAVFKIRVDQTTNPNNAAINIEPNGTIIRIPAGQTVSYTMTLKKVKQDQFNYNNIKILLESDCDVNAATFVLVSATFVPACSPVTIMAPSNNWLLNRNTAYTGTVTSPTNPVSIKLGGYNTSFASFQKINLEYRLKGTPNWIGLKTYYKNQIEYETARNGGETNGEIIIGTELNYAWDIAALGLANGSYELHARTSCDNQTAYESEIITGKVDLTAPVLFGTPTPKNGILNLGDDINLRFNEPIKTNGTVTRFEFLVQKNQLPVNHEVSLAFNGSSNTATINKPAITTGDFSIEFWLKNSSPTGTSTLLNQRDGIKIELIDNDLKYTIGGESIRATIAKDNTFNHYALSYDATAKRLSIIENDIEKQTRILNTIVNFNNENPVVLGGNSFKGNLHDLRFWKRNVTREAAVANMNAVLNGNETDLLGYWPISEGYGIIANDLARSKHLVIANTNWDIKPKGTAYAFNGTNYLELDQAARVIISKEMDATLSFWMKTNQNGTATLLSNGKGDATDSIKSNGYRNKWAINLNTAGKIELQAETKTFPFGNVIVNNDSWHHIALSLTRNGTIRMYLDGNQLSSYASSDLGGFSASRIFVGARGQVGSASASIDNKYVGLMDELCLWNMARDAEQIKAAQYHELNFESTGLLLYATFNKPEITNNFGPTYYYPLNTFEKVSSNALLNGYALAFSDETPAIKPRRPTESIVVNAVINGDEIVLNPQITNWASVEGKVAYITVSNLNDMADNSQQSPVTWSAFINKNPVKWFVEGHNDIVNLMKRADEKLTFDITIINRGGMPQPYTIGLPNWLTLSAKTGTLAPNTTVTLKATVDNNLATGNYNTILSLATNYGYNEKIQLNLRVLVKEVILELDPSKFTQSMNIIGRVKLDSVFTDDIYDKVIALVNGEVRGIADVVYDANFMEYFVYLTVYGNNINSEDIAFFIWDASVGKIKEAVLNDQFTIPFIPDNIMGTYTSPVIFKNTAITGQQIPFNKGWTWISFNVSDARFGNLNAFTRSLVLNTSDLILSNAPALFDAYQTNTLNPSESGWAGSVSSNGGISNNKMYKIKLATAQKLNAKGIPVNLNTWFFDLNQNWNWLPFVVSKNVLLADALANLKVSDGDLIKSQSLFAIYSTSIGWRGSLTYLIAGEGYMLKTAIPQRFTYPAYLNKQNSQTNPIKVASTNSVSVTSVNDELTIPLDAHYTKFVSTMSAVVKLPAGFDDLSFYNETGELRGQTTTQKVQGADLAFITIYGDKAEKLIAYIGSGNNKQATSKIINFMPDAVLGNLAKPVIIDLLVEKIQVFPNPFNDSFEIAIDTQEAGEAKVMLHNMFGQTVFEQTFKINAGANILKVQPNVPSGAYLIKLKIADKVIHQKIIKN
jgi:hypothetical protein